MAFKVPYCGSCTVCCCQRQVFRPVLMPWEAEKDFFGLTERVKKKLVLLKRKENGDCIFRTQGNRCAVYGRRPFECRIYPFILGISKGELKVSLHTQANCAKFLTESEGNDLLTPYKGKKIPRAWLNAYVRYTAMRRVERV